MKTLITAFALATATVAPASAIVLVPEMPTQFPQDGAFDGKGLKFILTGK